MKVLWLPQISSKSANGELMFEKDSNWAFFTNLLNSEFGDNEFDIGFDYSVDDYRFFMNIKNIEKKKIGVFGSDVHDYTTAPLERLHFDVQYYSMMLDKKKFDVVFNNEPAKATALRIVINSKSHKPKLVTYTHWLAMDNLPLQMFQQYEGMLNSDLNLVNSQYVVSRIVEFCNKHKLILPNIKVSPPSFDSSHMQPLKKCDKITGVVYNHRLSSDPYYHNALEILVDICHVTEQKIGFQNMPTIYFTNPSAKDTAIEKIKPYFKCIELGSQNEYYNFLKSDKVQVHLNTFFNSPGMWSMSTVESAITGNVCLLPENFGYAEIFGKNYLGYCEEPWEMEDRFCELLETGTDYNGYDDQIVRLWNDATIGKTLNRMLEELL